MLAVDLQTRYSHCNFFFVNKAHVNKCFASLHPLYNSVKSFKSDFFLFAGELCKKFKNFNWGFPHF